MLSSTMLAARNPYAAVDWQIARIAAIITNLRRMGKSDAKITEMLLAEEDGAKTNIIGGATQEMIALAFQYLRTGTMPAEVACACPAGAPEVFSPTCCPQKTPGTAGKTPWLWIGGGLAAVGVVAFLATR